MKDAIAIAIAGHADSKVVYGLTLIYGFFHGFLVTTEIPPLSGHLLYPCGACSLRGIRYADNRFRDEDSAAAILGRHAGRRRMECIGSELRQVRRLRQRSVHPRRQGGYPARQGGYGTGKHSLATGCRSGSTDRNLGRYSCNERHEANP